MECPLGHTKLTVIADDKTEKTVHGYSLKDRDIEIFTRCFTEGKSVTYVFIQYIYPGIILCFFWG